MTSSTLMKAILAMDSYNRGYNAGLVFGNDANDSEAINGVTQIGNYTVYRSLGNDVAKNISFYAIAYQYNGETVISYRGTDSLLDALTGYDIGAGVAIGATDGTAQGTMAFDFYNAVDALTTNSISVTGHSLGGGLAGAVAALTPASAEIFAPMAFTASVENLTPAHDFSDIHQTEILGQALQGVGGETDLPPSQVSVLDLGDHVLLDIDPIERHSMSTTVIRMYADTLADSSWRAADTYI